jgi:tetratricopeptide (TPR) repeat protein
MLGTLSVSHEDRALELPPSRKVRALLAYLALAPRAVPRHRLCRLLWDNASDPRGELRWSLSKLRGVVGASRIASSKDSIRLDLSDSFVDALEVQRAAQAGIGTLTAARKRELLALFEGEFLEGLELDVSLELTAWVLAQRRQFNAWQTALLKRVPESAPASSAAEQAYDCYLQGRQHLARMMQRGLDASRAMFVRALELDPGYAPAWAGLATVHACLYEWFDPRQVEVSRAEHASRRALEAAPQLAESHVARGLARSLTRHYEDAVGEFEAAIRINPYLFDAYYYFARTVFARVAHDAVLTGIGRAQRVLALNPHDGRALSLGAGALIADNQTERALEWSKRCLDLYPGDTSALVNVACVHARVGQPGEALDLLDRVFARGCGKRDWIVNDPDYASLRNEPRFHRLLGQLR